MNAIDSPALPGFDFVTWPAQTEFNGFPLWGGKVVIVSFGGGRPGCETYGWVRNLAGEMVKCPIDRHNRVLVGGRWFTEREWDH